MIDLNDPKVITLRAEYRRQFKENSGRDPPHSGERTFDDLLAKAGTIAEGDLDEARRLIEAAAAFGGDVLERDRFLNVVKKTLKTSAKIDALRNIWNEAAAKARAALAPTPEELIMMAAAAKRDREEQKQLEAKRLWAGAAPLAMLPDILADAVETAHLAGVVGEDNAIAAEYLAMTSRILAEDRVLSTCGTGPSSVGKSYVSEKVEKMMPPECVVAITSGSPKSLVYMVVENSEALKHTIVVVHETAGFIAADDVEHNPAGAIVRELLTRGRANYAYVEKDERGNLVTKKLTVEGPISLNTTSARDNLDPEMQNRVASIPSNESPKATRKIQMAQISGAAEKTRAKARPRIKAHIAHQRWLQANAPVRVAIPEDLRQAIFAKLGNLPDTVRTRRDVPAFLLAIKASAALHMAQRRKGVSGRVIATIDDYGTAHRAFDHFIALEYSTKLKPGELVVLAAIEKLIAADQAARKAQEEAWEAANTMFPFDHIPASKPKARISYDIIMAELNMKSRPTLAKRVKVLKAVGAIAFDERKFGRSVVWELMTTSEQANSARHGRFMPLTADVEAMLNDPTAREAKIKEFVTAAEKLPDWTIEEPEMKDDETEPEDESPWGGAK